MSYYTAVCLTMIVKIEIPSLEQLKSFGIVLDLGRVKNPNKNPVAERAVQEVEAEILKQDPTNIRNWLV